MKAKRHAKILELIQQRPIDTQEELLKSLKEYGYDVTQATVSRDIKELRLIKSLDRAGRYRYSSAKQDMDGISSKFHSLFADAVISIDYAQNILVVKCFSGMANAACAALDSMHWEGVVGTLSGDDTFLIICRSESHAVSLVTELKKLSKK
nr:arginine repressor [uncultured Solibaculum sp.]